MSIEETIKRGMEPQVARMGVLDMQVCVPKDWTDEQILEFAEKESPCGTECGWVIRKQGDKNLGGAEERVTCLDNADKVHVALDA